MYTLDEAGRDVGNVRLQPVRPELRNIVEYVWSERTPAAASFRVVPDPAAHLIFKVTNGQGGLDYRLDLVGARSVFRDVDKSRRVLTCGARLSAGAIPRLFGISAHEILNRTCPLEEVNAGAGAALLEKMVEAPEENVATVLQEWLVEGLHTSASVDGRLDALRHDRFPLVHTVQQLASSTRLSTRGVYEYTRRQVGLAPKLFLKVRRLLHALELGLARSTTWSRAACVAGFSDQAHLIRDCKALLGETPEQFSRRRLGLLRASS